jgi:hypothetical protein
VMLARWPDAPPRDASASPQDASSLPRVRQRRQSINGSFSVVL